MSPASIIAPPEEIMSEAKKLYDLALQAEREGNFPKALKLYRASAKTDPLFRASFNNLGALYSRAGRPDLALGFFKRALELGEDDMVCFNLGSESYKLKKYDESKAYLIRALKQNTGLFKAHVLLAYIYGKLKLFDRALIYFKNALKLEPKNRMAVLGYVVTLSELEKYEEALKFIESSPERKQDPTLKSLRAGMLLKLNRLQESLKDFEELTRSSKKFTSFTDHLTAVRKETDDHYEKVFVGIDNKIKERTARVRERLAQKKVSANRIAQPEKQDLKDLVDLSLLHLFNGDPDKALKFLFQAKKMGESKVSEN